MFGVFFCFLVACLMTLTQAACPYAKMMQTYNFSGDWVMQDDNGTSYVLHVCHPKGNEIFFGIAKNDTPNTLFGFGGGNWSQWNLGIIGIRYIFHGNKIDESGFIIGMNTEGHQWWFKDNNQSLPINQTTQQWISDSLCMVPFGFEIRREKYDKSKKAKANHNKAKRERTKQAKKKKVEIDEQKELEIESQHNQTLKALEESFQNLLPSLINTTWINDFYHNKISFYDNFACYSNVSSIYSIHSIKSWYDDVLFMSEWSSNNIHGAQVNMLLSNNEMITLMSYTDDNYHVNETLTFINVKHETKLVCDINNRNNNLNCQSNPNVHCEL